MQIILLSGGSGKRLWPLSNNTRSKQFIKILEYQESNRESMLQRVVRQLKESNLSASLTIATSANQKDVIINQIGDNISIVTEPERRDTFPAIALASSFLTYEKECDDDEVVVVMPCDPYTDIGYFDAISQMANVVSKNLADMALLGIKPSYPSTKYGYIVPDYSNNTIGYYSVSSFKEKPNELIAKALIEKNALWNGGVFAFKMGYIKNIIQKYLPYESFEYIRNNYGAFPKISFDYEVVENAQSIAVVPFEGKWKDLGTWDSLSSELHDHIIGNAVIDDESENSHIVNELEIPVMCIGVNNVVIAASNDGVLVCDKNKSEFIKTYADRLQMRPMFFETSWGENKIVDVINSSNGYQTIVNKLNIGRGKIIEDLHLNYNKQLMIIDGEGQAIIDNKKRNVKHGDLIEVNRGIKHTIIALSDLIILEIQSENGSNY